MLKVYRSFEEVPFNKNTVLTVGTFDGVHKGHQKILKRLLDISKKDNLRALMMTFFPHPQMVLKKTGKSPIQLLTTIHERAKVFEKFGLEHLLVAPFTLEFSKTSPEKFIRDYLCNEIGVKKVLIGYDHLFGKDRSGGVDLLKDLATELDYEVEKIDVLEEDQSAVSSTRIRQAIQEGCITEANSMLGWNYIVHGIVKKGDQRGRTIGYPTANIYSTEEGKLLPGRGVYAVRVITNDDVKFGMANVGKRPTFKENDPDILEVNIFDFNKNIYNEEVSVEFLNFIRHEKKFNGVEELLVQLRSDKKSVEKIINNL